MRRRRPQGGFTLVELMVSMVLVAIAVTLMMRVSIVILTGLRDQREGLELERNARAAIDVVTVAARNASAGAASGDIQDATACNPGGAIVVTNAKDGPDRIDIIHGAGGVVTSTRTTLAPGDSSVTVVDGSALAAGDLVIVTDGTTGRLLPVTSVTTAGGEYVLGTQTDLCPAVGLPATGFAPGALVIRARYTRIAIETDGDGVPNLVLDPDGDGPAAPELLAESVEDLQVAIGVDLDGDGTLLDLDSTNDEWFYNVDGDVAPPAITSGQWLALRLTVVARDRNARGATARPAAEDHPAGAVDNHRRRTLSTEIQIRNLGNTL